jgi:hypothetical protein
MPVGSIHEEISCKFNNKNTFAPFSGMKNKKNVDFLKHPSVSLPKTAGKVANIPNRKYDRGLNRDGLEPKEVTT